MDQFFFGVEASEGLPQDCMSDSVKRLLEVYEVVEEIVIVLWMLRYKDSAFENLFYCSPAWTKSCLFFCQQFLSLGFESFEYNSEHDLAGMAD